MASRILQVLQPVTVHLLPQIIQDRDQALVVCGGVDGVVKLYVHLRQAREIIRILQLHELPARLLQLLQKLRRDPLAGHLARHDFQGPPYLQHILQVLFRDAGHNGAPAGNHHHQPLQLQLADGLPDRRAAHAQTVRQMNLHQTLARLQLAAQDSLTQRLEHHVPQWQIFIHNRVDLLTHGVPLLLLYGVVRNSCFARRFLRRTDMARLALFRSSKIPNTVGPLPLISAASAPCSSIVSLIF